MGAWRDHGGGLARSVGSWQDPLIDWAAATRADLAPNGRPRQLNMSHLGRLLTDATLDPPISALLVWNANPMVSTPNVESIRRGLLREDLFTVVHEQFVTDTTRYADIVLAGHDTDRVGGRDPGVGPPVAGWSGRSTQSASPCPTANCTAASPARSA